MVTTLQQSQKEGEIQMTRQKMTFQPDYDAFMTHLKKSVIKKSLSQSCGWGAL